MAAPKEAPAQTAVAVEPPAMKRKQRTPSVNPEFVAAVAKLLNDGNSGSDGIAYSTAKEARAVVARLKKALVNTGEFANEQLGTRVWETEEGSDEYLLAIRVKSE